MLAKLQANDHTSVLPHVLTSKSFSNCDLVTQPILLRKAGLKPTYEQKNVGTVACAIEHHRPAVLQLHPFLGSLVTGYDAKTGTRRNNHSPQKAV